MSDHTEWLSATTKGMHILTRDEFESDAFGTKIDKGKFGLAIDEVLVEGTMDELVDFADRVRTLVNDYAANLLVPGDVDAITGEVRCPKCPHIAWRMIEGDTDRTWTVEKVERDFIYVHDDGGGDDDGDGNYALQCPSMHLSAVPWFISWDGG